MSIMTFTKGIGTPVYMAPEILRQERYSDKADIFSFGITIYEIIAWEECYPKTLFKFPWKIADFVMNGNRRPQKMEDSDFELISRCWCESIEQRPLIEFVIQKLEEIKENYLQKKKIKERNNNNNLIEEFIKEDESKDFNEIITSVKDENNINEN